MTTYSLSLDDVDLALLPLRTHKYNDFLKKEHFTFQVMKTEELEATEPPILYKCHICAIDVPAAFASEHAASLKHRANARIASVAARRTSALITAVPPPVIAQPAARFCANCSTLAGRNHEKTKGHRVAVMHDKLLWELMTAYVDDDRSDDSDTEDFTEKEHSRHYNDVATLEVNNNKEAKENIKPKLGNNERDKKQKDAEQNKENKPLVSKLKISEVTNNETEKNEPPKSSEIAIKRQINEVTNVETANNESPKTSGIANKRQINEVTNIETEKNVSIKSSEAAIKSGIIKCNGTDKETQITPKIAQEIASPSAPRQTQDVQEYVEFVNKENKIVKVFSDYYHGFTRRGDVINCKVCSSSFDSNEVDAHMFSLKHLNKMPSAIIDEHFVRKIDEAFSHCILCNQMVKHTNLAKHYLTIGHNQREKQLLTNPTQAATPTTSKINTNAKVTATNTPEIKKTEVKPIDWPVIYPYEVTKHGVRCVICNCDVPNNPENRKGHLVGLNHVKNVKSKRTVKLEYPYEATKKASIARCVICDMKVTVSSCSLKVHLNGLTHAANAINKRESQQKAASQTALQPAKALQNVSGDRTFASASDTIGRRRKNFYFSWV